MIKPKTVWWSTLEYFLDEHIEKCSINIFWFLSQAVKLRQHGTDCFL